ncbi:hypothetical protein DFH08DRAFT_1073988 [Mycena albidolilacea]|uniref:histidine kinase n=1 Tax=Mycena albidolilacea TaxID=1033008 RepID=A0AAD7AJJ6_9AGAR|nr:hypothetical protein DFH08DRAFT_1073988 [Mycena albidolilacea]
MVGKTLETSPDEDVDALAQWTLFLQEYAKGNEGAPPPPLRSTRSPKPFKAEVPELPTFVPLYPPGQISPETARTIADFYDQYGFLPPPRADEETVRQQTIQEYNLFRQDQLENFHRCSSLVNSFFHFAPVCTVSLFHNDVQVVVSKAGEFPVPMGLALDATTVGTEVEGEVLVVETSICAHVVLKKKGQTVELNELGGDWRFTGNPWCAADSNGVKGYVGVPITLEVDPSNPHDFERVTVGVVALMSNRPFLKMSDTQLKVLDDLSTLLSVQLRSTWESWQRLKETRLRNAVSLFLEKALVEQSQQALMDAAKAEPPVQGSESAATRRGVDVAALTRGLFANAAKSLQELLEADFAIIIDLTSFHATELTSRRSRSHSWVRDGQDSEAKVRLSRGILGSSCSAVYSGQAERFHTPEAMTAIAGFLDRYVATARSVFSGSGSFSGLETLLARSSSVPGSPVSKLTGAVPHLVLPFYSSHRPNIIIVVASAAPFFSFKAADVTFASNFGVVLVARLAQNAIVEADAAKTGRRCTQLDLVRDTLVAGELSVLPSLLDSAEFCGAALRDIVDDILDFGKTAQASHDGADTGGRPRHVLVDLVQVTVETTRSCWLRRVQWQSVTADSSSPPPVKLLVEYEDRSMLKNWWISLDLSGYMRILNSLVTNSLKYTAEGLITVSLTSASPSDDKEWDEDRHIILRVEDTGRGIAPEFLSKLFDPFTQADSFSPGAGLGLHICKSVVERMHGRISVESRLGGGSIFTVELPVEDIELHPAGSVQTMRRTMVSAEATPTPKLNPRLSAASLPRPTVSSPPRPLALSSDNITERKEKPEDDSPHLTILVVDDNAISRKILIRMLKNSNVSTYEAEDGVCALELFQEIHPHVVWTDISMPRMDGVAAAKEMRKIEQAEGLTPAHIVAITGLGLSDEYIRREALLGPAALDGWLIKGQTNLRSLKESLVAIRHKLKLSSTS